MPIVVAVICNGGLRGSESAVQRRTPPDLPQSCAISVGKKYFSGMQDLGNFCPQPDRRILEGAGRHLVRPATATLRSTTIRSKLRSFFSPPVPVSPLFLSYCPISLREGCVVPAVDKNLHNVCEGRE